MGNKQPGSRPSLVKYVNSSVWRHANKTLWHGDIKLKYWVHTRSHLHGVARTTRGSSSTLSNQPGILKSEACVVC